MNTKHHYLRLLRTFALATLTAAASVACSDDNPGGREPLTPPNGNPDIAVTFTADINLGSDANPASAPDTRTMLTPTTNNGFTVTWKGTDNNPTSGYDLIHIWAAQGTTTIGSKTYVPTTSAASSALEPENDQEPLTLTQTGEWTFTAVYGNNFFAGTMPQMILSSLTQSAPNNTEHIAANDFSVATATQNIAAENNQMPQDISLQFKHKLSALQLHVTNQSGEALTVKEIRLSAAGGQITSGKVYDVATGDWKAGEEKTSDYLMLTIDAPEALASGGTELQDFHMLLFPGYENETLTITVITSRGEYTLTKPAPSGGFAPAKNYMTNITLRTDGLGTDETWRETIRTPEELIAFRERVNGGDTYSGKTVYLADNIDLTGETWTPIGMNYNKRFSGTFDGGGYSISNLNVYFSIQYAGLFGYVLGGTVRNLRVCGNVTATEMYTGGIAGQVSSSTVENCIFSGNLSGENFVGGIAGKSGESSKIAGCHVNGSVRATAGKAGGIAGVNQTYSTIDDCYSEAEVKGSYAGGIAGENQSVGAITRCYATGQVSGTSYAGGIAGSHTGLRVNGCIALNLGLTRTDGNETTFGRIVGNNGGTVTSCAAFSGMTITDNASQPITAATGEAGDPLTAAACLTKATYTGCGFTAADATTSGWAFDAASPWTYLPWNKAFENFHSISVTDYRISVPNHLNGGGTN